MLMLRADSGTAVESAGASCQNVKATVVQKPFEFGYRSIKLLYELSTKGASALPANPIIDTGVEVVNKDNVAAFKAKLADLKK